MIFLGIVYIKIRDHNFRINSVTNAQMRGDGFNGGFFGARGARGWLFVGFVMGFAAVIAACWILFADFVAAGLYVICYLMFVCIILTSLICHFRCTT